MKLALCYFGLIRGFKFQNVYESHKKYIYDVLKEQNIEFSVFASTYDKDYDSLNIDKIPNLKMINKLSDAEITEKLKPMAEHFDCPKYYTEELKMNLLKCWYSQKELYKMLLQENENYDYIMVMDIGQLILNKLDNINSLEKDCIYVPNFAHHNGYCGRMLIGSMENMLFFLKKYEYIQEHLNTNIHPETFYKNYIENIGKLSVKYLNFKFWRCRTNGDLVKDFTFSK